jgi:hypothetical protein
MTGGDARTTIERFLRTDPADVGCEQTIALLHAYVELVVDGLDPAVEYPGIAAHLRACPPCADDHEGLLLTVRGTDAR